MLDLRAVRRETTSTSTAASPFAITIASIRAGHDVDLVVDDTLDELIAHTLSNPVVGDFTPPRSFTTPRLFLVPPQTPNDTCPSCPEYDRHFRPTQNNPYTNLGAFNSTGTPIDSAYTFSDVRAGNDISIQHKRNTANFFGTTISFTATTDVDATLTDIGMTQSVGTGQSLSTSDGVGKVDMTTNGFVRVTERTGDLRVGAITSTASDVTLFSPHRILDAESGAGVLGTDPTATDVTGVNITMTAGTALVTGGIGQQANFLETNVDVTILGSVGSLLFNAATVARAAGSFLVDGFVAGMVVHVGRHARSTATTRSPRSPRC